MLFMNDWDIDEAVARYGTRVRVLDALPEYRPSEGEVVDVDVYDNGEPEYYIKHDRDGLVYTYAAHELAEVEQE